MPFLVLSLIVIIAVVLYRQYADSRQRSEPIVVPAPDRPTPPRHQRVSDDELEERASALREAVDAGTIGFEEAVESLSRTCGLEPEAAADRLR